MNVHTAPHTDRNTELLTFFRSIKKLKTNDMVISIQTLCSIFSKSPLLISYSRESFGKDAASFSPLDLRMLCLSSCRSSSVLSDWMVNVGVQPFIGLSGDA